MQQKPLIIKILNVFENDNNSPNTDYSSIYIYKDGPGNKKQVTLGRGYTSMGGSLWMVFKKYKDLAKDPKIAEQLLGYESQRNNASLAEDDDFLKLIHKACSDPAMHQAEDAIYDQVYWNRGETWFTQNGFKFPLSMAVIQDTFLQSGSMLPFLTNKFSEKTPANGGDEQTWISAYVEVRNSWLANHSRKVLRNTVYRTEFFKKQLMNDNWNLDKFPIYPNDVKIVG